MDKSLPGTLAASEPLIFYDGYCHLCAGVVRFVMRHERQGRFKFAALQGQTARRLLDPKFTADNPGTVVFWDGQSLYSHSDAAIRILVGLGGVFRLWAVALVVPLNIRNAVYNFVARHRYFWFGRSEVCQYSFDNLDVRFLP